MAHLRQLGEDECHGAHELFHVLPRDAHRAVHHTRRHPVLQCNPSGQQNNDPGLLVRQPKDLEGILLATMVAITILVRLRIQSVPPVIQLEELWMLASITSSNLGFFTILASSVPRAT